MSDPLTLGLASTAVGLVNSTISLFKQVNEAAKKSDDLELKQGLNDLYGQFVELKAQVLDLAQENQELRKQLRQREEMRRDSQTGFYYQGQDPSPLCPNCYEREERFIHLRRVHLQGGLSCHLCHEVFNPEAE
jgi:hypothetical protein